MKNCAKYSGVILLCVRDRIVCLMASENRIATLPLPKYHCNVRSVCLQWETRLRYIIESEGRKGILFAMKWELLYVTTMQRL